MFVAGDLAAARAQIAARPSVAAFIANMQQADPLALTYDPDRHRRLAVHLPGDPRASRCCTTCWPADDRRAVSGRPPLAGHGHHGPLGALHWHFFFLGAAFLLLEVQNISKAAVVLGNTWQVNAVIISGVLATGPAGQPVRGPIPAAAHRPIYVALIGCAWGCTSSTCPGSRSCRTAKKAVVVGSLTTCRCCSAA